MNYQTEAISLWINNDEGLYDYWKEIAEEYAGDIVEEEDGSEGKEDADVDGLAERMKDELSDLDSVSNLSSMFSDLLTHALSQVDWNELAKDLLSE